MGDFPESKVFCIEFRVYITLSFEFDPILLFFVFYSILFYLKLYGNAECFLFFIHLVYHKNTEHDQFSEFVSTNTNIIQHLLNEWHLGLYYLSNDTNVVIFGSKLAKKH